MTRREAREIALCLVFDFGFNTEEKPEDLLNLYIEYFDEKNEFNNSKIKNNKYISNVYFGVAEKIGELDEVIKNCAVNWKFSRISRVSLSILRLAIYELMFMDDIPTEVTINEAVELAKKYDHSESFSFINGVLGAAEKMIGQNKIVRDKNAETETQDKPLKDSPEDPLENSLKDSNDNSDE